MDSMVNHYTVAKRRRGKDFYTPGGVMGARPDHACVVYSNLIRRTYKHAAIVLGGIEASLRRLAHYDYWSDSLKRSILLDSGADLVLYGMGEKSIVEVAEALDSGLSIDKVTWICGSAYKAHSLDEVYDYDLLPSFDELRADRPQLRPQLCRTVPQHGLRDGPPPGGALPGRQPLRGAEPAAAPAHHPRAGRRLRAALAPARWHPDFAGGADLLFDEVRFSIAANRGCFGECSFCAITFHQGRVLQIRSHKSIMEEARALTADPHFKGYITDVGGPTANFGRPACDKQAKHGVCSNRRCMWPTLCKNMVVEEDSYAELLRDLRQLPGVKKVFVRSGVRFDYTLADKSDKFLEELVNHHVSGQLRLAPEHVSDTVLAAMGKPPRAVYDAFCRRFEQVTRRAGKEQYVVPHLISSHPGSTMKEAVELAEAVRDMGYMPEQVQDFYPTPSTMSTCMYYTGVDPRNMQPIYVPRDPHEKAMQRALIQYRKPKNWRLGNRFPVGRTDLIGFGEKCLIRPYPPKERDERGRGKADGSPRGKRRTSRR